MVRFTAHPSAVSALKYFLTELSEDDITLESRPDLGHWFGKGAERLRLDGPVTREHFAALLGNTHPLDGTTLGRSTAARRAGVHVTIDPPKSVSVIAELLPDSGVYSAVVWAARETMRDGEARAQVRVRKGGADEDRRTGEIVAAEFVHRVTRPVDGAPDPQTHVHYFVLNHSFDPVEGKWKALEAGGMWEDAQILQAVFESHLARRLSEMGYEITTRDGGWEIAGVPDSVLDKFSRRSDVIENEAAARGVDNARARDGLGARTRESKSRGSAYSDIRAEWASRLSTSEHAALIAVTGDAERRREGAEAKRATREHSERERVQATEFGFTEGSRRSPLSGSDRKVLDEAIRVAVGKTFERAANVPERVLLQAGFNALPGKLHIEDVRESLLRHGVLTRELGGRVVCTTKEAVAEERKLIDLVVEGKQKYGVRSTDHVGALKGLTEEQAQAVRLTMASSDLVTIVEGRAGVGKTRLTTSAVREAWVQFGCPVCVLAPTARAARDVLRSEGHSRADTVAKFLSDEKLRATAKGGIIWIDEAGLLGTRDLNRVLQHATDLKARVVLMMDDHQHRSVARSGWRDALERYADVKVATVEGVMRQKGAYKEVVERLNRGDMAGAVERMEGIGALRVVKREDVEKAAAADYVASRVKGDSVLLVTQTHRQAADVTVHVREALRERGELKKDQTVLTLRSRGLTEFERGEAKSYRAGDVVEFHRTVKTPLAGLTGGVFPAGSRWHVLGHDPFGNVVVSSGIKILALPVHKAAAWDVYERSTIQLAAGDKIRITKSAAVPSITDKVLAPFIPGRREPSHPVTNGQFLEVARVSSGGKVTLKNGLQLPKDFGHLTHGYCVTSQSAQGLTVDRTIGLMTSDAGMASNPRHFYVAATRGSKSVRMYTDSKESLLDAVTRPDDSVSATTVVSEGYTPKKGPAHERSKRVMEEAMRNRAHEEAMREERTRAMSR
jgi:conjugative relaxase-like TrwC/TraI family protein